MPIPSPIPSSSSPSYWISPDDPHTPSSGTTSQSSPIVGDHHKVSDTFQNQHSHASGTISGDAAGGSASGNVQQDTFAPSDQHSPDLAQQEPWANQPQHTFPNPQQGSDASTTASSPITSEGSGGTTSQSSPIVGSHPDSAAPPTASNAVYGGSGTPIEETSGNAAPQSSASAPVSTGGTSSAGGDSGGFQGSGSSSSFDDSSSTQGYSGDFQGSGSSSSFDGPSSSTEGYPQSSGDASGSAPLSGFNGAGASIGAATAAGAAGGASNQDLQCHAGDPAPTTAQNAGGTPHRKW